MFNTGIIGLEKKLGSFILIVLIFTINSCCGTRTNTGVTKTFDTITNRWVYVFADEYPIYDNDPQGFLKAFNKNFDGCNKVEEFLMESMHYTVQFVIDKTGCLIGARIKGKNEKDWTDNERCVINNILKYNNWTPGKINGHSVDVLVTCHIVF